LRLKQEEIDPDVVFYGVRIRPQRTAELRNHQRIALQSGRRVDCTKTPLTAGKSTFLCPLHAPNYTPAFCTIAKTNNISRVIL
jgi:hypothetical protein